MNGRDVLSRLTYGLVRPSNQAPVAYASPSGGNMFGFGGGNIGGSLESMEAVSTLQSIIRLTSQSTARVDWHLYRKSPDGRRVYGPVEDNRREVTSHAALNLLNKPNPLMTRQEFIERTQQHIDLAGEAFWAIEKVQGIPLEMWPLRPDRMEEVVNSAGELVGWKYREPDGKKTGFETDQIIHIQTPSPTNIYRGISPVRSLMVDLETTTAAGTYARNFFRNSAIPGGFYIAPSVMEDHEFKRFVERQRESHQGVGNAHRAGVLENGMKWQDASYSMADMQFIDLRNVSRELLREAYGIHQHMLGLSDDVNRANAVAASIDFARWQLIPRLERIEQALNHVLLPMFGSTAQQIEFCYADPIPDDPEQENADRDSRVRAVVLLIRAGADPVQTLEAFGLPSIDFPDNRIPDSLTADPGAGDPTQDLTQTLEAA